MDISIYISISNVCGFSFLHILNNCHFYLLTITLLTNLRWYPTVGVVCISLVISWALFDKPVGNLYVSFWEIFLRSFTDFLVEFFFFSIMMWEIVMYFGYYLSSNTWRANIFSQFTHCLPISWGVSFTVHKIFTLIHSHLIIFAFVG